MDLLTIYSDEKYMGIIVLRNWTCTPSLNCDLVSRV